MKKLSQKEFLEKAKAVHGDKYDYSITKYTIVRNNIEIICPIHGIFIQKALTHLQGSGCPKCVGKFLDQDYFIEKSKKIHGDKYDYSNVKYCGNKKHVEIICPKHGSFWQTPNMHLRKNGCPKCFREQTTIPKEKVLELMKSTHLDKYDYSKTIINKNISEKVCITCPKHGDFWQSPGNHIYLKHGCPLCRLKAQTEIYMFFKNKFPDITWIWEYRDEWLGRQRIDIYAKELNIGIEYDGQQHFKPVDIFGGEEGFNKQIERDQLKLQKCIDRKCKIFRIKYDYCKEDLNSIVNELEKYIKNYNRQQ